MHSPAATSRYFRTPVQAVARVVAYTFFVVGLLGLVLGVTTTYDLPTFAEPQSGAELFGWFSVSVMLDVVHLILGVTGFASARTATAARVYLVLGGCLYLLLSVWGLLVPTPGPVSA